MGFRAKHDRADSSLLNVWWAGWLKLDHFVRRAVGLGSLPAVEHDSNLGHGTTAIPWRIQSKLSPGTGADKFPGAAIFMIVPRRFERQWAAFGIGERSGNDFRTSRKMFQRPDALVNEVSKSGV